MPSPFLRPLASAVATLLLAIAPLSAQHARACSTDRYQRDLFLEMLTGLMLDEDSVNRRIYRLPRVSPDSIRLVTDERVCERLAHTYYRRRLGPRPAHGVLVARVGDLYAVYGKPTGGHYDILGIYTSDFTLVITALL